MFGIHYNTLKVKYIEVFRPIAITSPAIMI